MNKSEIKAMTSDVLEFSQAIDFPVRIGGRCHSDALIRLCYCVNSLANTIEEQGFIIESLAKKLNTGE